jgi:uncharacterized protein (DUF779 family)
METQVQRVIATEAAEEMIGKLKSHFGELVFHQSGGCCDGSAPMCFERGELMMDPQSDVLMGEIAGCEFYMSSDQYEYWKHTQLIIDLVQGRGASFSLEIPTGFRFITKSRLFTDEELEIVLS